MNKIKIPVILQKMNNIFEKNGFKAYLVGGAVRDMFMNKEASDWDVATDATPEQVISAFKKVIIWKRRMIILYRALVFQTLQVLLKIFVVE